MVKGVPSHVFPTRHQRWRGQVMMHESGNTAQMALRRQPSRQAAVNGDNPPDQH
jgi:hypothetical protein